jgi:hypothetical protein
MRLLTLDPAPHVGDMPPADNQTAVFVLRALSKSHQSLTVGRLFQHVNLPDGDQRITVDANEFVGEFLLEMIERIIDEVLAVAVLYTHIFLIRAEANNITNRNKL